MKAKSIKRNIVVFAENVDNDTGYNIYIEFSGKREFLMYHRHNGLLFSILKDKVSINDLERLNYRSLCGNHGGRSAMRKRQARMESSVNHLMNVINEYLMEYDDCSVA